MSFTATTSANSILAAAQSSAHFPEPNTAQAPPPPQAPAPPRLELLVADAHRCFEEGGKLQNLSFWSFKTMMRTYHPQFLTPPKIEGFAQASSAPTNFIDSGAGFVDYCTWHRYSDWEWFVDALMDACPGTLIPPVPEKESDATKDKLVDMVKAKQNETAKTNPLVQTRIRRFNIFLSVLSQIPEVFETDEAKAFFTFEEANWLGFKEHWKRKKYGGGIASVLKGKFFSAVSKVSERNAVVFDASTPIGSIQAAQEEQGRQLERCKLFMETVQGAAHQDPPRLTEIDEIFRANSEKPMPYPLVYTGHYVACEEHLNGTVKYVDDHHAAYVDWSEGRVERCDPSKFKYPQSGVVDPVAFAAGDFLMQLDSHFAYVKRRNEAKDLEHLIDLFWFWSAYAQHAFKEVVRRLTDIENKRYTAAQETSKLKDVGKRQAKQDEADKLGMKFRRAERHLEEQYGFLFRPLQRKALFDLAMLSGKVGFQLFSDEEWPERVRRADSVLECNFDIPDDVQAMMNTLGDQPAPSFAE